jgi:hypothetical protein
MVSKPYLLREPPPPGELKRFFDQRIIPAAIDRAAWLDMGMLKTYQHMRRNPATAFGVATAMGVLLVACLKPRRARNR